MMQRLIVGLISVPSSSHSTVMIKRRGEVDIVVRGIRKQISHGVNFEVFMRNEARKRMESACGPMKKKKKKKRGFAVDVQYL